MFLSRFSRIVLLAPPLGGAALAVGALGSAGLFLVHHGSFQDRVGHSAAAPVRLSPASSGVVGNTLVRPSAAVALSASPVSSQLRSKHNAAAARMAPAPALFEHPIPSEDLRFLSGFASQPSRELSRDAMFRQLVGAVTPYAPFHFGVDMPLANVLEGMLRSSDAPVQVRDGRYVMAVGQRSLEGRGGAFLWIDTQQGLAVGGIFFYPSNGEPSPTLTLFSNQVQADTIHIAQLPPAFLQDFIRWTDEASVPAATARYFINAASKKSVLVHDERRCGPSGISAAPATASCAEQQVEAASVDRQADAFLARVHYAPNGTQHTLNDPFQPHETEAR